MVYADKLQKLGHLEDNIRLVIADIRPQMLEKVIENWTSRLDYIRASRGSHMPEFISKIVDKKTETIEGNQALPKLTRLIVPSLNCGSGDMCCRHYIVPSGNFAELICTVTCMALKADDRRTSSPLSRWISWASFRLHQIGGISNNTDICFLMDRVWFPFIGHFNS
ncbi:hypothetical protein TNCV_1594851 [Trichonephila clavipes]|nr:hypothetical protein TNCV_1594851 [Trichonephila clavipes]